MDDEKTLVLQEKYYFYELDCREKLVARLQLTLAVISGLLGVLIYILAHVDLQKYSTTAPWAIFDVVSMAAIGTAAAACWKFVLALWASGSYKVLPTPEKIEEYRQLLVTTYAPYENAVQLAESYFRKFLISYYAKCASHNSKHNENRYELLHDATSFVVFSIPFIVVMAADFIIAGIGKAPAVP